MSGPKRALPAARREGVVTALVSKKERSERVTVYVDGSRLFDVAAVVVERSDLHTGDRLDLDWQDSLLAQDAPYRARHKALGMLAIRDRCRKEVETRLKRAGFSEDIASSTVSWLRDLGYVDDLRFAGALAGERLRAGWGVRRIRAELLQKGVEREAVDLALETAEAGEEAEAAGLEAMLALARKRFGGQFRIDPASAGRKLAGYLARRGYDWDTIGAVKRTLLQEAGGETEAGGGDADAGDPWITR